MQYALCETTPHCASKWVMKRGGSSMRHMTSRFRLRNGASYWRKWRRNGLTGSAGSTLDPGAKGSLSYCSGAPSHPVPPSRDIADIVAFFDDRAPEPLFEFVDPLQFVDAGTLGVTSEVV